MSIIANGLEASENCHPFRLPVSLSSFVCPMTRNKKVGAVNASYSITAPLLVGQIHSRYSLGSIREQIAARKVRQRFFHMLLSPVNTAFSRLLASKDHDPRPNKVKDETRGCSPDHSESRLLLIIAPFAPSDFLCRSFILLSPYELLHFLSIGCVLSRLKILSVRLQAFPPGRDSWSETIHATFRNRCMLQP